MHAQHAQRIKSTSRRKREDIRRMSSQILEETGSSGRQEARKGGTLLSSGILSSVQIQIIHPEHATVASIVLLACIIKIL